jgi:hypothetical protein
VARCSQASSRAQVVSKRCLAVYLLQCLFRKHSFEVIGTLEQPLRWHARSWALKALAGLVDSPRNSSVTSCANRSAAGACAMAFRGINGGLPTAAARRWAPAIYSTVPLRTRPCAALSVSRGDRRMRGRKQLNTTPDAEGSTAVENQFAAPSEIRAGGFGQMQMSAASSLALVGRRRRCLYSLYELLPCEINVMTFSGLMAPCAVGGIGVGRRVNWWGCKRNTPKHCGRLIPRNRYGGCKAGDGPRSSRCCKQNGGEPCG